LKCDARFTTYERIDEIPYMVIKKDGRRERFDRQNLQGLLKSWRSACAHRELEAWSTSRAVCPRSPEPSEDQRDRRTPDEPLKKLDKVAYVRFASVYLDSRTSKSSCPN